MPMENRLKLHHQQNIPGASQQNRLAALSWNTEVDEVRFWNLKKAVGKTPNGSIQLQISSSSCTSFRHNVCYTFNWTVKIPPYKGLNTNVLSNWFGITFQIVNFPFKIFVDVKAALLVIVIIQVESFVLEQETKWSVYFSWWKKSNLEAAHPIMHYSYPLLNVQTCFFYKSIYKFFTWLNSTAS